MNNQIKINNVYIPSLEASDIYNHMAHDHYIKFDYVGMIPDSLELRKLHKQKEFLTFTSKYNKDKELSNDVINVKFKQKVKSAKELIKIFNKKIESTSDEEYKQKLIDYVNQIKSNPDAYQEVSSKELRKLLYKEGFTINKINKKTGKVEEVKYLFYKRSSSKSRQGQAWFIRAELHDKMTKWSRMNLPLKEGQPIDLAGLLAYESLIASSIEDTVKIDPDSILIVDELISKFKEKVNVIKKNEEGNLDSFEEIVEIENNIFDGEGLLDSSLFNGQLKGKGMMLLRQHFFKAAVFNTNISQFFQAYAKQHNINYDTWYIKDMFGNKIKATDVKMIINPTCLKALKFSHLIGDKKDMWQWWKDRVREDDSIFGIVKHEKPTKRGYKDGKPLQCMSYQMLNSLPATREDIEKLSEFERDYIMQLKNDDETFIQYIKENANAVNANEMFVQLYKINKNIARNKIFRDFRKSTIKNYVNHVKKGKIRLVGDYCVMAGNLVEYLYYAIGENITEPLALKGNEIYTILFDFNKELVGFRNPHTSQSNVLKVKNTYNKDIDTYFNLTDNIVVVNTINFNLPNILSGSDFDSDTVVLFDDETLLKLADKCYGHYNVCVNGIPSDKTEYHFTLEDMAAIDNKLAQSQTQIGEVVNTGQLALSLYWDGLNNEKNKNDEYIKALLKKVDTMTILSGLAIDNAKRQYDIDINEQVKNVRNQLDLKTKNGVTYKPDFWRNVTQNENTKFAHYNCPMDFLYDIMSNLKRADRKEPIELIDLLVKKDNNKANRKQRGKAKEIACKLENNIAAIKTAGGNEDEMYNKIEEATDEAIEKLKKLKVNENTMYSILKMISDELEDNKGALRLMNLLYQTQRDVFLQAFKK